ncbi:hypothetical protein GGS23DRAFT_601380 [Durotheca rogersii]|uniref:uncharacterized protein n=1 Tax=Durotheca rogersii TaxID=419775 RepID=UPI00221F1F84|nr:uncharacterized protein GGS23DRAFT_601380 [Durotheca rogersii]KAI5855548.1 hypothetical protein GGS23DRAFT_601380 [Durotheca rogersii]
MSQNDNDPNPSVTPQAGQGNSRCHDEPKARSGEGPVSQKAAQDGPNRTPVLLYPARPEYGPVFGQAIWKRPEEPEPLDDPRTSIFSDDFPIGDDYAPDEDLRKTTSPFFRAFIESYDRFMNTETRIRTVFVLFPKTWGDDMMYAANL